MLVGQQCCSVNARGPRITTQRFVSFLDAARRGMPHNVTNKDHASAAARGRLLRNSHRVPRQIPHAAALQPRATPQPFSQPSGTDRLLRGTSQASWIDAAPSDGDRNGIAVAASALAEPPPIAAPGSDADRLAGESPVTRIFKPEELDDQLARHGPGLTVLMCKAHSCRPCKMFSRKFARLADAYPDVSFLEIFGDDDKATRGMMVKMGIKVTPTFHLYRSSECVHKLSGINETNLRNAVEEHKSS